MKSLRDKTVPRFRLSLIAVLLTMGATAQANSLVGNLSFSGFGNAITLTTYQRPLTPSDLGTITNTQVSTLTAGSRTAPNTTGLSEVTKLTATDVHTAPVGGGNSGVFASANNVLINFLAPILPSSNLQTPETYKTLSNASALITLGLAVPFIDPLIHPVDLFTVGGIKVTLEGLIVDAGTFTQNVSTLALSYAAILSDGIAKDNTAATVQLTFSDTNNLATGPVSFAGGVSSVPLPAAVFFVSPVLAGIFGFLRRKNGSNATV